MDSNPFIDATDCSGPVSRRSTSESERRRFNRRNRYNPVLRDVSDPHSGSPPCRAGEAAPCGVFRGKSSAAEAGGEFLFDSQAVCPAGKRKLEFSAFCRFWCVGNDAGFNAGKSRQVRGRSAQDGGSCLRVRCPQPGIASDSGTTTVDQDSERTSTRKWRSPTTNHARSRRLPRRCAFGESVPSRSVCWIARGRTTSSSS